MTDELNIVEVDASTGEQVERPMTADEIAAYEDQMAIIAAEQAQHEDREAVRQSALEKLAKLGLTEEEANAIVGA